VAVPAVDENPGEGRKEEGGNLARESDKAEEERGIGEPINQPAHGNPLHPGPYQGNTLPGKKETVISVTERPHQKSQRALVV
jgi:hypothetical protein